MPTSTLSHPARRKSKAMPKRQRDLITLSVRDSEHLAALVLNPPAPNMHLRAALRRHAVPVEDAEL